METLAYETLVYIFAGAVVLCLFMISMMFAYIVSLRKKILPDVEEGVTTRTSSNASVRTLNKKINSIKRNQKSDRFEYYTKSGMPIGPMSALTIGTCNSVKLAGHGHPRADCEKSLPNLAKTIGCFPSAPCISKARIGSVLRGSRRKVGVNVHNANAQINQDRMLGINNVGNINNVNNALGTSHQHASNTNSSGSNGSNDSNNSNTSGISCTSGRRILTSGKGSKVLRAAKSRNTKAASKSKAKNRSAKQVEKSQSRKRLMHSLSKNSGFVVLDKCGGRGTSGNCDDRDDIRDEEADELGVPKLHSLQSLDFNDETMGFSNIIASFSRPSGKRGTYNISFKNRLSKSSLRKVRKSLSRKSSASSRRGSSPKQDIFRDLRQAPLGAPGACPSQSSSFASHKPLPGSIIYNRESIQNLQVQTQNMMSSAGNLDVMKGSPLGPTPAGDF